MSAEQPANDRLHGTNLGEYLVDDLYGPALHEGESARADASATAPRPPLRVSPLRAPERSTPLDESPAMTSLLISSVGALVGLVLVLGLTTAILAGLVVYLSLGHPCQNSPVARRPVSVEERAPRRSHTYGYAPSSTTADSVSLAPLDSSLAQRARPEL